MRALKKLLYRKAPNVYCYCRDRYQFAKSVLNGELSALKKDALEVRSFEQAFEFTNQYIKSYQITAEIQGLIELVQKHKPANYMEIGTADGGTHYLIRKLCTSIEKSIAIDLDIRNKFVIDRITTTTQSHYLLGSSLAQSTIDKVKAILAGTNLDVLFIDGDHSYEGVKADFDAYQQMVKEGGLIVFHDIVEDWQQRYGCETNKYTGGVPKLFAEIKDNYQHYTFIEDPGQDGFGIGVIVQR